MRRGRPSKLRLKKSAKRKSYGAARRGAKSPKQIPASLGRRRGRRRR